MVLSNEKVVAPYGLWDSIITPEHLTEKSCRFSHMVCENGFVYWSETRPEEKGRSVVVRYDGKNKKDMFEAPFSASSKVHEYGGGEFCVKNNIVYFVNKQDQAIYKTDGTYEPKSITPADNKRYADLIVDEKKSKLYAVCEIHEQDEKEPKNCLISVDIDKQSEPKIIEQGADFYASPKISPCLKKICWVEWNHPNLPWDNTKLFVGELGDEIKNKKQIAGMSGSCIVQPKWDKKGNLYYVDDVSGWWNIYRYQDDSGSKNIYETKREFGLPFWVFGQSTYDFDKNDNIIASYKKNGISKLVLFDFVNDRRIRPDIDITHIEKLVFLDDDKIFLIAGSGKTFLCVQKLSFRDETLEVVKSQSEIELDEDYISLPQTVEFCNRHNDVCYGYLYLPTNPKYDTLSDDEKPPLIVKTHGGPTGSTEATLSLKTQYWTSRGFAVFDVNYSGSTGFGTEYRKRLEENWGILDLTDCEDGVSYLIKEEIVDENKVGISGGSAGGYTTLCALTFSDMFKVGASYYGVSDVLALMKETHKFEKNYDISMFGKGKERFEIMKKRSPINYKEKLNCPIIFFQGLKDMVVPPNQSEDMYEALREKNIDTKYITFEEEGHGFRSKEAIETSIKEEFDFFVKHLNIRKK